MKNVLKPLAKSILIPLRWTAAPSATDAAIQKKIYGSGFPSDISTVNHSIDNFKWRNRKIMKIGKSLKESELLIKGKR